MPVPHPVQASSRGASALWALVLALISLPLLALAQFVAHARTDEMDGFLFACVGRELLRGATLYRDVWDIKPPGIFWVNSAGLWLGGGALAGVWVVCGLALVASVAAIGLIALRCYGPAAGFAAAVFAAAYLPLHDFHVGGNRPSTFLVLTDLLAMAMYVRAWQPGARDRGWFFLAGTFAGMSFCFLQTGLAAAGALALHLVWMGLCAEGPAGVALRRFAAFACGWLATVGACVLIIAAAADLVWAWDAVFTIPFGSWRGRGGSILTGLDWVPRFADTLALPLVLAVSVAAHGLIRGFSRNAKHSSAASPRTIVPGQLGLLWVWLLLAIGLASFGVRGRPWYLAPALAPLILLAVYALHLLIDFANRVPGPRPSFAIVVAAVWFVVMLAAPVRSQVEMALRQSHLRFDAAPDASAEALIAAIEAHTRVDEAIFLAGYQPDVYWRTGRPPACRYFGTVNAGAWDDPRNPVMRRIAEELQARPPRVLQWSPPDASGAQAAEFDAWLAGRYHLDESGVPGLWIRKDAAAR